jgi:hypothetical protein
MDIEKWMKLIAPCDIIWKWFTWSYHKWPAPIVVKGVFQVFIFFVAVVAFCVVSLFVCMRNGHANLINFFRCFNAFNAATTALLCVFHSHLLARRHEAMWSQLNLPLPVSFTLFRIFNMCDYLCLITFDPRKCLFNAIMMSYFYLIISNERQIKNILSL